MTFPEQRRQFLHIMVARYRYWYDKRSFNFHFEEDIDAQAEKYSKMTYSYESFKREGFKNYEGDSFEAFDTIQTRRQVFFRAERDTLIRQTLEFIHGLNVPTEEVLYRRELKNNHVRHAFDWALHELGLKQWEPEEIYPDSLELQVSRLSSATLEKLDELLLQIARQQAMLDVISEVRHYLNGHDTFTLTPKMEKDSVSEIARDVLERFPDKNRVERKEIARTEYKPSSSYRWRTDKRSIDKALDSAFAREEKKMSTKAKK